MESTTVLTEAMRRELILADGFARAAGERLDTVDDDRREHCRKLARSILPAVNRLLADERANTQAELTSSVADQVKRSAQKAYIDGFADGEAGTYNNRWEGRWQTPGS